MINLKKTHIILLLYFINIGTFNYKTRYDKDFMRNLMLWASYYQANRIYEDSSYEKKIKESEFLDRMFKARDSIFGLFEDSNNAQQHLLGLIIATVKHLGLAANTDSLISSEDSDSLECSNESDHSQEIAHPKGGGESF